MELGHLLTAFNVKCSQPEREEMGEIGQPYSLESCTQTVVLRPTAGRSTTWELIEMQMLRPHSRLAESASVFKQDA